MILSIFDETQIEINGNLRLRYFFGVIGNYVIFENHLRYFRY